MTTDSETGSAAPTVTDVVVDPGAPAGLLAPPGQGGSRRRGQRGESLAAYAFLAPNMLLLGVFALSFSTLGDLESRIGMNQKASQQALALAESGLEHGRNMLRGAAPALNFNAYLVDATARKLGTPSGGATTRSPGSCAPAPDPRIR